MFLFEHNSPERFTQGRWVRRDQVSVPYLLYRTVLAWYFVGMYVWDIVVYDGTYWWKHFIYLSNLGFGSLACTLLLDHILVSWRCCSSGRRSRGPIAGNFVLAGIHLSWFLTNLTYPIALVITITYWSLLCDTAKPPSNPMKMLSNYNFHLVQGVVVIIDTVVSSRPWRISHVWTSLTFGLLYSMFNMVYVSLGGTNENGDPWVYTVLKWNTEAGTAMGYVAATLAADILMHLLLYGLSNLRDYVWIKLSKMTNSDVADAFSSPDQKDGHNP